MATALPPPDLFTTCMRWEMSFSFCNISAIARANRSEPPPGPVCTTASICLLGLNSWPQAEPSDIAAMTAAVTDNKMTLDFIFHASPDFQPIA